MPLIKGYKYVNARETPGKNVGPEEMFFDEKYHGKFVPENMPDSYGDKPDPSDTERKKRVRRVMAEALSRGMFAPPQGMRMR